MDVYPNAVASAALTPQDTRQIAQALHTYVRINNRTTNISPFVEQVVQDIKAGVLPPHPYAQVHLLGIYKEWKWFDDGYAFWQWLIQQDETLVSDAVYGAAIELLAYGRKVSLPDLENLYVQALKRFPGTFAEYHLSPDAIVPDRGQPIPMVDTPVLLLQGILTARILARDWKNAYLALDTALRLFPATLPTRFFELFMTQRPLPEAYTVYLIACRAGIVFKASNLTALITQLRAVMAATTSLRDRTMILRAMANAIYAYVEAGGTLENVHVNAFISSFDTLLPGKAPGQDYEGETAVLRNTIVTTAHGIMSTLLQAGLAPQSHNFITLINLAGKLRVPDLLKVSLQDIRTSGGDVDEIGARTILSSAGYLGAKDLVEEFWTRIASQAEGQGRLISYEDWITFAKACKRADHLDYFRGQLAKFEHTISSYLHSKVIDSIETKELLSSDNTIELMDTKAFTSEFEALRNQIKNVAAVVMSGQPLDLRKSPFYMSIDPDSKPLGSDQELRTLYDEFTIDPHQPPLPPDNAAHLPTALSSTGIPLDELRFQNWVSINDLMDSAQSYEEERQKVIEYKVAHRKHFRGKFELTGRLRNKNRKFLLPLEHLRERVKQLRAPSTTGFPTSHWALSEHQPDTVGDRDSSVKEEALTEASFAAEMYEAEPFMPYSTAAEIPSQPPTDKTGLETSDQLHPPKRTEPYLTMSRRPLGERKRSEDVESEEKAAFGPE